MKDIILCWVIGWLVWASWLACHEPRRADS